MKISPPTPPAEESDRADDTSQTSAKERIPNPYPTTRACQISQAAEVVDIVQDLLIDAGASLLYGSSNSGKTFFILDLEAAVASGVSFRDEMEVESGAVIHVALEGEVGIRNRIVAMRKSNLLPDHAELYVMHTPCSLLSPQDTTRLVDTVREVANQAKQTVRLVVIDTLSRAMAGGDENAARDMTTAVAAIDAIRAATGAHVMLIHHCGKDEARGARGHSSLRAAVDTEIEVSRDEGTGISTALVTKQRDMAKREPMPYTLKVVELGTDRRGHPITSCVVHHEDPVMATTRTQGRKAAYQADQLLAFLPAESVKQWQQNVMSETGMSRSKFFEFKALLDSKNLIRRNGETIEKP